VEKIMKNIFSIDLESWVHFYREINVINKLEESSERKRVDNGYIKSAVNYILKVFERHNVKATFFILGEIFDWYPEAIDKIQKAGHEIGYHTHDHKILLKSEILEQQLEKSKAFINRYKPKGFRAPCIYLKRDSLRILKDLGFDYSSSTYGSFSNRVNIEGIEEIPVSSFQYVRRYKKPVQMPRHMTLIMLFKEIPFGSGLFFAIFKSKISNFIRILERRNEPAVLFVHPWQVYKLKEINYVTLKLKTLFKNPLAFPYTIGIDNAFEKVLSQHEFISFKEFRNEYRKILE
jgi:peptidoglycan/xylan/chitin deacetylase (PgdA/CDA1 family)